MPDEANPTEWFSEDKPADTAEVAGSEDAVPGAESDFPNLASVPPKPDSPGGPDPASPDTKAPPPVCQPNLNDPDPQGCEG